MHLFILKYISYSVAEFFVVGDQRSTFLELCVCVYTYIHTHARTHIQYGCNPDLDDARGEKDSQVQIQNMFQRKKLKMMTH